MSETLNLGLVVASTRAKRFADHPLAWSLDHLRERGGLDVDVIDIRETSLPYYDLPVAPAMAHRQYTLDVERELGERFDAVDGLLVIVNEFNHSFSAPLKNVLDHYYAEFSHKPMAFIGYGNVGGARAIEQLRLVAAELDMVSVRHTVNILGQHMMAINTGTDATTVLAPLGSRLELMLDNLEWWMRATKAQRARD